MMEDPTIRRPRVPLVQVDSWVPQESFSFSILGKTACVDCCFYTGSPFFYNDSE